MLAVFLASASLILPSVVTPGQEWVRQTPVIASSSVVKQHATLQDNALVFPTTVNIVGLFGGDSLPKPSKDAIPGSAKDIDLGSLLGSVPEDPNGKKGIERDEAGKERLKERQAIIEQQAMEKAEILKEISE